VPDAKRRYFDAAQRHIWAWKAGEETDSETGASHLAHAICCLMFIMETK
jgi:ribosomal protein L32